MGHEEILVIKRAYENLEESLFLRQVNFGTRQMEGYSQEIQDISGDLSRELTRLRRSIREEMNEVVLALLLQQPELTLQYPYNFFRFLVHPECRYVKVREIPDLDCEYFKPVRASPYKLRILQQVPNILKRSNSDELLVNYQKQVIAQELENARACLRVKELADVDVMADAINKLFYGGSYNRVIVIDPSGCERLREFCFKNCIQLIQEVK